MGDESGADRKSTRLNSSHLGISYAASTEISTLSLHDALPISRCLTCRRTPGAFARSPRNTAVTTMDGRRIRRGSEEHTSELQSLRHLVCRLHRDLHSFPTRRSSDLSVPDMQANSRRFRALAAQYGGHYDGWATNPA